MKALTEDQLKALLENAWEHAFRHGFVDGVGYAGWGAKLDEAEINPNSERKRDDKIKELIGGVL